MNLTFCIVFWFTFVVVVGVFIIYLFNIIQHSITIHFTITGRQKKRGKTLKKKQKTKKQKTRNTKVQQINNNKKNKQKNNNSARLLNYYK